MGLGATLIVVVLMAASAGVAVTEEESEEEKESFWSQFKDPEDGKFDLVGDREGGSGFLPIVIPFNEPVFGFGAVLGLAYFHPQDAEVARERAGGRDVPPSTTFGLGAYSENGTWALAGGHHGVWRDGRVRYLGALTYASANLNFYGIGADIVPGGFSIPFEIEGWGIVQKAKVRLGNSPFFLGGKYSYLASDVAFRFTTDLALEGTSKLAGLSVLLDYDTRDNSFTPNHGSYVKTSFTRFADKLGGDFNYNGFDLEMFRWWLLFRERVVFGGRFELHHAGDGAPFYALPWVGLRGIPAYRFLGRYAVTAEIEPRWKLDKRWSVLGFYGTGRAAKHFDTLDDAERASSYGAGFRYLVARKLGLAIGADIAKGSEDTILYLAFGNSWSR